MIATTTLAALRKNGACVEGYNKLVRALQGEKFSEADAERETYIRFAHNDAIPLAFILESNGLDDALWSLRASNAIQRDMRLFAVWCARQVQHLMKDQRSLDALDVAERHANGEATGAELAAARDATRATTWHAAMAVAGDAAMAAAGDAAWATTWDAAGDAARAAAGDAARATTWDAAGNAAWDAQKQRFIEVFCTEAT